MLDKTEENAIAEGTVLALTETTMSSVVDTTEEEHETLTPVADATVEKEDNENEVSILDTTDDSSEKSVNKAQDGVVAGIKGEIEAGYGFKKAYPPQKPEDTPTTESDTSLTDMLEESFTDKRDDPFALRQGKTLVWKNVNMALVSAAND
jgi:hypothetical protein